MKRLFLVAALSLAGAVQAADIAATAPAATTAAAPARDDSKAYYSMGFMTGKNIQGAIPGMDLEKVHRPACAMPLPASSLP
jgi:hypothetical protein